MKTSLASVTVCSICGSQLNGKRGCLACLLRAGLDEPLDDPAAASGSLAFGDFEIARREDGSLWELGRGAMGVTYLALDKVLNRSVALKVIEVPPAVSGWQAMRERFLREARSAAALRHPNVAGVFHFAASIESNCCYYAMELVEGETLEARVRRDGPLGVEPALEIAIQVTQALMAAAAHGLIHRDLKPGNIMLTCGEAAELEVKVIDFGLAKATADAAGDMDLTHGGFVGTPTFASPEQFSSGPIDARSDIYSLGVTLWYALTGLVPYTGRTIDEIRNCQKRAALPIEQLVARKVPAPLIKLLRRTLAVEPAQRPASARELTEALESCRRKLAHGIGVFYKLTALIAVLAIAGATLLILRVNRQKITAASANNIAPSASALTLLPEKSIAVLPFENLSADKDNSYFAGGVQDELLSDLAKIADLKVISRTSVLQYRSGVPRNLREIGNALGVAHVLEGSVQRVANRVRVNAQLIDTRTDAHLWAQTYDRDLADVFAIQTEIAQKIADQLQAKILPREKAAIEQRPTKDLVAYDLYVHATALIEGSAYSSSKEKDLFQGIELLNQAIARDSAFLLAYCSLAQAHDELYLEKIDRRPSRLELAKSAINSAFRLKPESGEAHLALATHLYHGYLDYDHARDELDIASRTLPNNARIFEWSGYIDRRQNRWHDAVRDFNHAMELDPRNVKILTSAAVTYELLREYKQAREAIDRLIAIEPNNIDHRARRAFIDLHERADTRAAHSVVKTGLHLRFYERDAVAADRALGVRGEDTFDARGIGGTRFSRAYLGGLVARMKGDAAAAHAAFAAARTQQEEAVRARPDDGPVLCVLGLIDAGLGRKEDALREGRRAVELAPIAKDSLDGADVLYFYAVICAWTGERNLAIEQLETLAKIPAGVSYGDIRLNPNWDPLRGDPRFEKIVAGLAPEVAGNTAPSASTLTPLPEKSIAVLPFENLSAEKNDAFFADGIQDDVLTSLATIKELKVISHTSVMAYRDAGARNTREIGRTLGVANVLEGSVRRVGDRVVVNVQLVDTRTDRHLWAKHYDRTLTDSLGLQGEVANEIATVLQATPSPNEKARVELRPTNSVPAYEAYLRGIAAEQRGPWRIVDLQDSARAFSEAVQIDPGFALAWAKLSIIHSSIYWMGRDRTAQRLAEARKALDKAGALDPDASQFYLARGYYHYWGEKNYEVAVRDFDEAMKRLPNSADALFALSLIDRRLGRWEEALTHMAQAARLNPRSSVILDNWGITLHYLRRFAESRAVLDRGLESAPNDASLIIAKAWNYQEEGDLETAAKLLQPLPPQPPDSEWQQVQYNQLLYERHFQQLIEMEQTALRQDGLSAGIRALNLAALGRAQKLAGDDRAAHASFLAARDILGREQRQNAPDEFGFVINLAFVHVGLGDKQAALREAERAVAVTANDALYLPQLQVLVAEIHAQFGDADAVLRNLPRLLQTPASDITSAELRLDPIWDPIRKDPRFQKLCQEKSKP